MIQIKNIYKIFGDPVHFEQFCDVDAIRIGRHIIAPAALFKVVGIGFEFLINKLGPRLGLLLLIQEYNNFVRFNQAVDLQLDTDHHVN